MEFWGIEVKPGNSYQVKPNANKFLHLSQATLGEFKKDKGNDQVTIFLKIGNQKLVLGILSHDKFPQIAFDLVFEKDFELSHNSKSGSVYFYGYQSFGMSEYLGSTEVSDLNTESEEEDDVILLDNGDPLPKVEKPDSATTKPNNPIKLESAGKPKVKIVEPSKDDDSSDDDDDSVGESDESDDDLLSADSDENDDESDDDEEETPKKADQRKKRPNESIKQTPVAAKKAKAATTSGKTDSKKSGHTDTPHPAKKGIAKTGSGSGPAKIETPKTGGQHTCNSCSRSFGSEMALRSHNQAKHGAAK